MMPKTVASLLFAWRNLVGETLFKYLEYRSNLFVVNLVVTFEDNETFRSLKVSTNWDLVLVVSYQGFCAMYFHL